MFNSEVADDMIMGTIKEHDKNGDESISLDEFLKVVRVHPEIMYPAFHVQEQVRKKLFGTKYWKQMTLKREKLFGGADSSVGSSMEALYNILNVKVNERRIRMAKEREQQIEMQKQEE